MPVEILQRLREKYPQYHDIPDAELARRILAKYPQYQDALGDIASPRPSWARRQFEYLIQPRDVEIRALQPAGVRYGAEGLLPGSEQPRTFRAPGIVEFLGELPSRIAEGIVAGGSAAGALRLPPAGVLRPGVRREATAQATAQTTGARAIQEALGRPLPALPARAGGALVTPPPGTPTRVGPSLPSLTPAQRMQTGVRPSAPPPTIFSRMKIVPLEQRVSQTAANPTVIVQSIAPRKPLAPIGGAGDPVVKQTTYQRLAEDMLRQPKGLSEAARAFSQGALRQANSVMRAMGAEGDDVVTRATSAIEEARLNAGEILGRLRRIAAPLPEQSWEKIRLAREGTAVQLTVREQRAAAAIDEYLNSVVPRARSVGLEVGELPNYWPIRLDPAQAERKASEAITAIMERTGADAQRAEQIFRNFLRNQRTGRPFGNLERTREHWAPHFLRKPARQEFMEYVPGAERRIAEAKHLGPNDEAANAALNAIRQRNPQNGAFADQWFDAVTRREHRDVLLGDFAKQVGGLQAASKMGFSVISNASQPINNLLVVDLKTFGKGLRDILNPLTRDEALDFGRRTGAALETTMRELAEEVGVEGLGAGTRAGEAVLRKTGFLTVEGGNRLFTAVVGRQWARDLTQRLMRNTADAKVRRHLARVGLDADEIIRAGGKLTDAQERLAGLRLSELTQFGTGAGELPLWWSSPWGRVVTQFKRFAYKQGQLVYTSVVEEAKRGNFKPLAVLLTAFPAVGEVVADARYLLRRGPVEIYRGVREEGLVGVGRGVSRAFATRPSGLLGRLSENFSYVGALGMASDLFRAVIARSPEEAVTSFLGGPTFQEVASFGGGILRTGQEITKAAQGEDTSFPGAHRLAGQAVRLGVTPGLSATFGLPGTVLAKAIEGLPVFRSPEADRRQLGQKIVAAARRGDHETEQRLQDEYLKDYGRYFDVRPALRRKP